ncbi:MAG: hypothetical protein GY745_03950 [Actinomycetia bacterium]|nr:hypothetical protein [Actinomycetes bacterium]MCP4084194.1 hypothetical protein [Actinomycetes bacterium]
MAWVGNDPELSSGGAILDLDTSTWQPTSLGPTGRPYEVRPVAVDGRVVYLDPVIRKLAIYDLDTDTWAETPLPLWLTRGPVEHQPRTIVQAGPSHVMVWNETTGQGAIINIDNITTDDGPAERD